MFNSIRRASVIAATFLVLPAAAMAQDRLVMKNGDVITGAISKVLGGKVFIKPSYAGEISVSVGEIESMDAGQTFEVELEDDRSLEGSIAATSGGRQEVMTETGPVPITLADIAAATPPEKHFTWDALVDFNLTENSGNTDSRNTLLFSAGEAKIGDHRHHGDITFRREQIDGIDTKEQDLLNYGYDYIFADPWYVGGTLSYERDPIRELDQRYTVGLIVGRDIFNDAAKYLTFSAGVGYSDEEIGNMTESGAVGLWNLLYEHTVWAGVNFFHSHKITQQFYAEDNLVFKSNTGVRLDLFDNLYANLSYRYDYETEPAAGASKDDQTLAIGVGYSF